MPTCDGTAREQQLLDEVLKKNAAAFMSNAYDLGYTENIKHRINLRTNKPVAQPYRRIAPHLMEEVHQHLKELLEKDVIEESVSPYAAPIVVVRKKDGSIRLCIDYRKLNAETIPDAYPLPRIEESFDALSGAKFFSTLDLGMGYYQIAMEPEDKEKTAFITPFGLHQHKRLPQGLSTSPATFQRLMQRTLDQYIFKSVLVYLDDILIYSRTFEDHLRKIDEILQLIIKTGLKLRPDKCQFLRKEVNYLGHTISAEGVRGNEENIERVKNWKTPETVEELRSFLGLASYFRRFIPDFAKTAGPLHDLVSANTEPGKKKKRKRSAVEIKTQWKELHQKAFDGLKKGLTSDPLLGFADFDKPFLLETDASHEGLGAILSQEQDGKVKVIAYASRRLRPTERNQANYSSLKLEFLAMKWAITEKFKDYLAGAKFVVMTDNNPLVHFKTATGALEQRWAAKLEAFNFEVKYRPGKTNPADPLSRYPEPIDSTKIDSGMACQLYWKQLEKEEMASTSKQLQDPLQLPNGRRQPPEGSPESTSCAQVHSEHNILCQEGRHSLCATKLHASPLQDILFGQKNDPVISKFLESWPRQPKTDGSKQAVALRKEFRRLQMRNGILYRRVRLGGREEVDQVLLPRNLRAEALASTHDEMGHQGMERTAHLLRSRCYWPGMYKDVKTYIENCDRCSLTRPQEPHGHTGHLLASRPLEVVAMDFVKLGTASNGQTTALVMTDVFTKYSQAVAVPNEEATTVADVLTTKWFHLFGVPERIHADQGRAFESKLVEELCKLHGVKKSRSTPYHPQGNGQCERFNGTLIKMLKTLPEQQKQRWPKELGALCDAYNKTPHSSTGLSPYYLMFGRHPQLDIDVLLGRPTTSSDLPVNKYVASHRDRLRRAHLAAFCRMKEEAAKREQQQRHLPLTPLKPMDKVRLRIHPRDNKKLRNLWTPEIYTVEKQNDNGTCQIYCLDPPDLRTVNRDQLKLIGTGLDFDELPDIVCESASSDED